MKCMVPVLMLFVLAGCSKEPLMVIKPPTEVAVIIEDTLFTFDNPVNKVLLLELINDYRSKGCNCGDTFMAPAVPLTWNEKLERASWLHSKEMSDSGYFSHTGSNGSNAGKRIAQMGYKWKVYEENIALGILTEKTLIKGLMGSVVHCKAMMNPKANETAVALYKNFWTQELAVR
ncbi:CAP domain-containing protein [Chitinophaga sp. SYP-B3965]|uniref:CAP domain-containing protein n=1 Tax=Chitinophaga sp. SYP-B3965 TaxID=2663120 RepID=UPI0015631C94|nr:CAP domain-containing protein [Chitinophaga sp. SYP-B3965]